jgi:hypothetical protein
VAIDEGEREATIGGRSTSGSGWSSTGTSTMVRSVGTPPDSHADRGWGDDPLSEGVGTMGS